MKYLKYYESSKSFVNPFGENRFLYCYKGTKSDVKSHINIDEGNIYNQKRWDYYDKRF